MSQTSCIPAVTIENGPSDWQILQQGADGTATITLSGRWWTVLKRPCPEVRVSVIREGTFSPVTRHHDRLLAETVADELVTGAGSGQGSGQGLVSGEDTGKSGRWRVRLPGIPAGGPYRIDTCIGSAEDAMEWRRGGEGIHFLGVGDVWLIAGQSNAEGYGRNPVEDFSEIGVHECLETGWRLAVHGSLHHPWLAFAKTLKRQLGYPVGLIPTAVGGTPVSRWDPGQNGDLFARMADRVNASGSNIKGCLWYQGESDTGAEDVPEYKTRFGRFVIGVRELVDQPKLPLITVQLNRLLSADNDTGWEAIREIQRQLSHEVDGVFLIAAFEAALCDGIHNGSLGNLLIAQRAADTALGGVYGKDIAFKHPECVGIERVDETTIDLHFAHVIGRLDYAAALSTGFPFAVRDKSGEARVTGYSLPDKCTVRIELARPIADSATVTGVPGSCAAHVIPKDISGYRCMLGFTLPVEAKKPETVPPRGDGVTGSRGHGVTGSRGHGVLLLFGTDREERRSPA